MSQTLGAGQSGFIDLQGSNNWVTSKAKGKWERTRDGRLKIVLNRKAHLLSPSGANWKGDGLTLKPLCSNYVKGKITSPKGVTAPKLEGTVWAFRSPSWNGYVDFRKGGVYWTHWGFGKWKLSPKGRLTMKNDYDTFTFQLSLNDKGTMFKGKRSDGSRANFILIGRY